MRTMIVSVFFDEHIVTGLCLLDTGRKNTLKRKNRHINIYPHIWSILIFNVNQET